MLWIEEEPDARTIRWIFEPDGGVGKSSFVKYLFVEKGAIFCCGTKTTDIINVVYNAIKGGRDPRTIVWDLPRSSRGKISWNALEYLKNGMISNTKYETEDIAFAYPHIIIFANHPPVVEDLYGDTNISKDKLKIYTIVNKKIVEQF